MCFVSKNIFILQFILLQLIILHFILLQFILLQLIILKDFNGLFQNFFILKLHLHWAVL
ncbi:hypothetical protein NUSPORA_01267 [Nucleospora cyclopteri]